MESNAVEVCCACVSVFVRIASPTLFHLFLLSIWLKAAVANISNLHKILDVDGDLHLPPPLPADVDKKIFENKQENPLVGGSGRRVDIILRSELAMHLPMKKRRAKSSDYKWKLRVSAIIADILKSRVGSAKSGLGCMDGTKRRHFYGFNQIKSVLFF